MDFAKKSTFPRGRDVTKRAHTPQLFAKQCVPHQCLFREDGTLFPRSCVTKRQRRKRFHTHHRYIQEKNKPRRQNWKSVVETQVEEYVSSSLSDKTDEELEDGEEEDYEEYDDQTYSDYLDCAESTKEPEWGESDSDYEDETHTRSPTDLYQSVLYRHKECVRRNNRNCRCFLPNVPSCSTTHPNHPNESRVYSEKKTEERLPFGSRLLSQGEIRSYFERPEFLIRDGQDAVDWKDHYLVDFDWNGFGLYEDWRKDGESAPNYYELAVQRLQLFVLGKARYATREAMKRICEREKDPYYSGCSSVFLNDHLDLPREAEKIVDSSTDEYGEKYQYGSSAIFYIDAIHTPDGAPCIMIYNRETQKAIFLYEDFWEECSMNDDLERSCTEEGALFDPTSWGATSLPRFYKRTFHPDDDGYEDGQLTNIHSVRDEFGVVTTMEYNYQTNHGYTLEIQRHTRGEKTFFLVSHDRSFCRSSSLYNKKAMIYDVEGRYICSIWFRPEGKCTLYFGSHSRMRRFVHYDVTDMESDLFAFQDYLSRDRNSFDMCVLPNPLHWSNNRELQSFIHDKIGSFSDIMEEHRMIEIK